MLVLGARVSILRRKHGVSMGSGDQPDLARALRVFGNFTEWVPMIIIGLVLCELVGAPALLLHLIGIAVILSRLLHVAGLRTDRATAARSLGVLLIWASALTTGGYLVYASLA
jgi:uncharacterized membrane protein YecN with MAPEG domain